MGTCCPRRHHLLHPEHNRDCASGAYCTPFSATQTNDQALHFIALHARRYHLLHPEYILHRIREQSRLFRLTVLLAHVDLVGDDAVRPLGEVTRAAVLGDCTLVCAWSPEVGGRLGSCGFKVGSSSQPRCALGWGVRYFCRA